MEEFKFTLQDTLAKTKSVMNNNKHQNVRVAYSGGSDSDTVMWVLRQAGFEVKGVLYDTGIEWDATMRHVDFMREQGFDIDVIRAVRPVPTSNKKYGHPFLNKRVSDYLQRLQKHNFKFQEHGSLDFDTLYEMYPRSKSALRWWTNNWGENSRFNIDQNTWLKEFLIKYGLPFAVSGKCCDGAKKLPIKQYAKEHDIDLMILGLRKSEGGARATVYKSCYLPKKSYTYSMYFPLFYWNNKMKEWYDKTYEIPHSDCYTKYGLTRTGCAGCPFGRNFDDELEQLETWEPKLAKGIKNIFSPVYDWTRKYREFQAEMSSKTGVEIEEKDNAVFGL